MAVNKTKNQKPKEGEVLFTIYDFPIKSNALYEVQEKLDSQAPDGFVEYRTSKLLSEPIKDSYSAAIYDTQRRLWDTGLYPTSRSFNEAFAGSELGKDVVFGRIQDFIIKPFEEEKGETLLRHTSDNNEFWDNYRIEVTRGQIFDTSKIDDLINLYFLLIHKRLTPKEHESNPLFKQPVSSYLVVDKEGALSRQAEKESIRMEAIATFYTLLSNDKKGLLSILDYLGIQANDSTAKETLIRVFNDWVNSKTDKFQNDKLFLETVKTYNSKDGEQLFYIFTTLKELHKKGKIKLNRGAVYMDDVYVENGWKNSAMKIQKDKELQELFASLVD